MSPSQRSSHAPGTAEINGGQLIDNHGRALTYLRLAITDRCNLRCRYCMPEHGVEPLSHDEMLRYEELERLVRIFMGLGLTKVRITGGEPFARRGCLEFLQRLRHDVGVRRLYLTTNGVAVADHLDELQELPIAGINLSLDTLDRSRFHDITRRDQLKQVLATLHGAIDRAIPLKLNCVVGERTRDEDIVSLASLAYRHDISVRFIEQMAFSGDGHPLQHAEIPLRQRLLQLVPGLQEYSGARASTARLFTGKKLRGSIGVIEGQTRNFCFACNRLRITPEGMLKTCLYDNGVLDLRHMLRTGAGDRQIVEAVRTCTASRNADGHRTEMRLERGCRQSMATIGG